MRSLVTPVGSARLQDAHRKLGETAPPSARGNRFSSLRGVECAVGVQVTKVSLGMRGASAKGVNKPADAFAVCMGGRSK